MSHQYPMLKMDKPLNSKQIIAQIPNNTSLALKLLKILNKNKKLAIINSKSVKLILVCLQS